MKRIIAFFGVICLVLLVSQQALSQCTPCGSPTTIAVDLSSNPDTIWSTTSIRNGECCGHTGTRCIRFDIILHPDANEFQFSVASPAPPSFPGSFYQIDCGDTLELGVPVCITGLTSFCLVFCKSGGDSPTYTITTSQTFGASDDITVSSNCTGELTVEGMDQGTINWTSISPGAPGTYDGYLTCTDFCDTTYVTPPASGYPDSVVYVVSGTPLGCSTGAASDTIVVYIVDGVAVNITPAAPAICFGSSDATLTANASGGAPPYSYQWYDSGGPLPGETSSTLTTGVGTYWVVVTDTTTGCPGGSDTVTVIAHPSNITADAGPDQTLCISSPDATLAGVVTVATGGTWSGGGGTYVPDNNTLNATYTPSAAELAAGTVTLTLTTTGNGGCPAESDAVTLTFLPDPIVDAGPDQTVCASSPAATLAGSITGGATAGQWTTSGSGAFSPSNTDPGATYTPSAADISAGTVTLTLTATDGCAPINDAMTITILPAPIVDAGADQTSCANDPDVTLAGSVTGGATAGQWTTGGSGTFSPTDTDMGATYTPSAADITAGTVTITLTATDGCAPDFDQMVITIGPAPVVDAGPDQIVCASSPDVVLSGSVTGGSTTGQWTTSGSGTFSPSNTNLGATYTPSAADISAGTVTITLTSTANGTCLPENDAMTITILAAPTVDAGADQTVCETTPAVTLSGTIGGGATTGQWTTSGSGTFSPSNTDMGATYTPSAADITAGTVTITLENTDGCATFTDNMVITIDAAHMVDAGPDQTVCATAPATVLAGSITGGSTTGQWTTSGSGTFSPSSTDPGATYNPSAADISGGTVTITLTSDPNGSCPTASDVMVITITASPTVDAGADQTVCETTPAVTLNGTIGGGATTGQWTTGGSGAFSPSNTDMNATYTPSAADITAGTVTITLENTDGCATFTDNMVITIDLAHVVDAGPDQIVCETAPNATLAGSITGGSTTGTWTTSGSGTFSPSATDLNATYSPSAADISAGTVTITLTSDAGGSCPTASDVMILTITSAPIVDAGADQTICESSPSVTLSGSVTGGATAGQWTTSGSGTFSPSDTDLGATYNPSAADIAAGSVTITLTATDGCAPLTDDMVITIDLAHVVDAGADEIVCESSPDVTLSGSITGGSTTGSWTTSGSGTFSPSATDLNATYNPSAADIAAGTVTLTLTSDAGGSCPTASDAMTITILPAPIVDAGPDDTQCANNMSFALAGTIGGGATAGQWTTSGSGTFSPSDTDPNATYNPSAADIVSGSVTITLTSTDGCVAVSDDLVLTITPAPVVNAGPDQILCATAPDATLAGTVTGGSTTGIWTTTGSGTFSPSDTDLNATYAPSAADIAAGSVTLTLTSTGNGSCLAEDNTMTITILPAPTVDAGPDDTQCANNMSFVLSGTIGGGATNGQWTSSGSGSFTPSATDLNVTYNPSAADITAGSVTITLTNTDGCDVLTDDLVLTITPAPVVDAGADTSVCINNPDVSLSGTVTGGSTTGIWTTSGTGTFSPSDTDLNATYIPSNADTAAGTVTLTLTSTGNGLCSAESDDMVITYTVAPIAVAGPDQFVCNTDVAVLSGTILNGSGTGQWTTSGSGTFTPSDTDLNATYNPSPADTVAGSVNIVLTSTNNGGCLAVTDTLTLIFTSPPMVNAGTDVTICGNDTVSLAGLVSGSSTTGVWGTSGTGTFIPSDTDLNGSYVPTAADEAAGTVTITLTSTNACVVADDFTLTLDPSPVVDAGPDQVICVTDNTVTLAGSVSGATTTGIWTTNGTGTFTPSDTDLNATYNVTSADSATGGFYVVLTSTANGACPAATDTMFVTITTAPTVDAGADIIACANAPVPLAGTVTGGAGTGTWTTSGSGTFAPDADDLNATYNFSSADTTVGSVTLTLTSTNACVNPSDDLTITITPAPNVNAGPDMTVCEGDVVNLNGSVTQGATTGIWGSDGTGSFSPNDSALTTAYLPDAADYAAGTNTIVLTSTNNGDCLAETDTMIVTYDPAPVADAGGDIISCGTNPVSLSGSVTGGGGTGIWTTTGSGTFTPSDTDLGADYNPTSADTAAGSILVILTTTNNGTCTASTDTLTISFEELPTVNAGADISICSSADSVALSGTISGAIATGSWSTTGDGVFVPDSTLNTMYAIGPGDVFAGSVDIILSSDPSAGCSSVSDTLTITIAPGPVADAGPDQDICLDNIVTTMDGSITGTSSTGIWTTGGTGIFAPNDSTLNALYTPGTADTVAGSVTLYLTSTNNGLCAADVDSMVITFSTVPYAYAGSDTVACNSDSVFLAGSASSNSTITWTTNGAGTFAPSDTAIAPVYVPDVSDNGPVEVYLTVTNACGSITDTLIITFDVAPTADFNYTPDCDNYEVVFSDNSTGATLWSWDFGDLNTSTLQNPTNQYPAAGSYDVTLYVENASGCSDSITQTLTIDDPPIADFIASDTVVDMGQNIDFTDQSTGATGWMWDFGDGGMDTVQNPSYSYGSEGTYTVMLIVTNDAGCADTAYATIEVLGLSESLPPAIPSGFTPNGDSWNDMLLVRGGPFIEFDFRVFNEWGNELFQSNDQDIGWDGTYNGKKQPSGVYVYTFMGTTIEGQEVNEAGNVTLIR